jgi:Domain of unknown function (DUF4253)
MSLRTPRQVLKRIDHVPSPFPFAIVPGREAETALDELMRLRPDSTPVILGKPETAAHLFIEDNDRTRPRLLFSLSDLSDVDSDRWLRDRIAELNRIGSHAPRGPWPMSGAPSDDRLSTVRDVLGRRELLHQVVVALLPTTEPWLAAIFLNFGDRNGNPAPIIHAAMARRWGLSYGAVPIAFSTDTVEFRIERPVGTQDEAIALALEHFAFCPDIVLQGTQTIERLAASLIGARHWFFWWD